MKGIIKNNGWDEPRNFATAPRDGTPILLWSVISKEWDVYMYCEKSNFWHTNNGMMYWPKSEDKWLPLPEMDKK